MFLNIFPDQSEQWISVFVSLFHLELKIQSPLSCRLICLCLSFFPEISFEFVWHFLCYIDSRPDRIQIVPNSNILAWKKQEYLSFFIFVQSLLLFCNSEMSFVCCFEEGGREGCPWGQWKRGERGEREKREEREERERKRWKDSKLSGLYGSNSWVYKELSCCRR